MQLYFINWEQDSTYGTYKVLGDTLRENPHLLVHRATEVVDNVLKRDAAYFQVNQSFSHSQRIRVLVEPF